MPGAGAGWERADGETTQEHGDVTLENRSHPNSALRESSPRDLLGRQQSCVRVNVLHGKRKFEQGTRSRAKIGEMLILIES